MFICNFVKGQGLLKMPDGSWTNKIMHVEWHGTFGPVLMTKDWHESAKRQPPEDSQFWDLMSEWSCADCAVDGKGYCLGVNGLRLSLSSLN